jgi:hypothetical protein
MIQNDNMPTLPRLKDKAPVTIREDLVAWENRSAVVTSHMTKQDFLLISLQRRKLIQRLKASFHYQLA